MTSYNERYTNADQTVSAYNAASLAESDTATFPTTRAIYVGSGGDVAVEMNGGAQVTFVGVGTGTILPIQIRKLLTTTTASSILGLY